PRKRLGPRVPARALPPPRIPSLWEAVSAGLLDDEIIADIEDPHASIEAVARAQPSLVLHMAAQSLVRRSYAQPVRTFATNLMGSVHLLEALRGCDTLEAALIVTTDKVYANSDLPRDFVDSGH